MKKMKFILPRIIGLTVIAGIATLLMSLVFKVLVLASIVGIIVSLVGRKMSRRRQMMQQYGMQGQQGFGQMPGGPESYFGQSPFHRSDVAPVYNAQRSSAIIPIN